MVGRKEEETEVFLETLARLLIDPAIGHFKLGCFNQPKNSSRRAYSFIFFSQKVCMNTLFYFACFEHTAFKNIENGGLWELYAVTLDGRMGRTGHTS